MSISLTAEPIFYISSFPITNTLIVSWLVILFLAVTSFLLFKKLKEEPHGYQNLIETVIEGMLNFIINIAGSYKKAIKFFPLVSTIFIFVLFSNWIEILPGLGTIGLKEIDEGKETLIPFIRSSSADLNFTLALAIVSVLATQIFGISELGFFKYVSKFLVSPFKKPYLISTFVGILELISEGAKLLSFSFRLFGNIFAGEVLLLVILFLAPYIVPLPFLALEIFVGLVQALVFSMLTLVFLKMATEH